MSYYSPVAPIEVLLQMKEKGFLDPHLLLLAHDVVKKPDQYQKLLKGFEGTTILDNSLIELGKPIEPELLIQAAYYVKPSFAVLPDILNDSKATIDLALSAINSWAAKLPTETGFMVAAQGRTFDEAAKCFTTIAQKATRHIIAGIPRIIANQLGTRAPLIQMLDRQNFDMHLLGMSDFFEDDVTCARMLGVMGIDSASPLRAGWENKAYVNGDTSGFRNREEFFNSCKGFSLMMAHNVGYVKGRIHKHG